MVEKLAEKIASAFVVDTNTDRSSLTRVYSDWLQSKLSELGQLGEELKIEVISELSSEKIAEIKSSKLEQLQLIVEADKIEIRLIPLNLQSLIWAEQVKNNNFLSRNENKIAKNMLDKLNEIELDTKDLPDEYSSGFADQISEIYLDLKYSLEEGNSPMSLRLGKFDN